MHVIWCFIWRMYVCMCVCMYKREMVERKKLFTRTRSVWNRNSHLHYLFIISASRFARLLLGLKVIWDYSVEEKMSVQVVLLETAIIYVDVCIFSFSLSHIQYIYIIILSRRLRGYPWPSLAISPYHSDQSNILYHLIYIKVSKVCDCIRKHPFHSLLPWCVEEGAIPFSGLLHFILDPYLIMLCSVRRYQVPHVNRLYDSILDWNSVSRAIGAHSTHLQMMRKKNVSEKQWQALEEKVLEWW